MVRLRIERTAWIAIGILLVHEPVAIIVDAVITGGGRLEFTEAVPGTAAVIVGVERPQAPTRMAFAFATGSSSRMS